MRSYGRPRVLVCDDEETVREICARALRSAGYDMIATASGGEAIAVARLGSFDVALVDVRLPDFDGPEVIARLHERDVDLPCVVMSAYASFDDAVKCLHHGAVDFVRKPFDLDTLVRAISLFPLMPAVKQILAWSGLECGAPLPPRTPLTPGEAARLRGALEGAGLAAALGLREARA